MESTDTLPAPDEHVTADTFISKMIMPNLYQFVFHRHGGSHSSIVNWSSKQKNMNKRIRNTNKQGAKDGKNNDPTC